MLWCEGDHNTGWPIVSPGLRQDYGFTYLLSQTCSTILSQWIDKENEDKGSFTFCHSFFTFYKSFWMLKEGRFWHGIVRCSGIKLIQPRYCSSGVSSANSLVMAQEKTNPCSHGWVADREKVALNPRFACTNTLHYHIPSMANHSKKKEKKSWRNFC